MLSWDCATLVWADVAVSNSSPSHLSLLACLSRQSLGVYCTDNCAAAEVGDGSCHDPWRHNPVTLTCSEGLPTLVLVVFFRQINKDKITDAADKTW